MEQSNYPIIFLTIPGKDFPRQESLKDIEVLPSSKTLGYNWHFHTSQERESKAHQVPRTVSLFF